MKMLGRIAYRAAVIFFLFIIAANVVSMSVAMGQLSEPVNQYGLFILLMVGIIASAFSERE